MLVASIWYLIKTISSSLENFEITIEATIMFTTCAFEQERCLTKLQKKESCVNYEDICFLNLYHDKSRRYINMM